MPGFQIYGLWVQRSKVQRFKPPENRCANLNYWTLNVELWNPVSDTFIPIQALWILSGPCVRDRKFLSLFDWVDFHRNTFFELFCIANSGIVCWAWQTPDCDHPMLPVAPLPKLIFGRFSFFGEHSAHRWSLQPKGTGPYPLKLNWIGHRQSPVCCLVQEHQE